MHQGRQLRRSSHAKYAARAAVQRAPQAFDRWEPGTDKGRQHHGVQLDLVPALLPAQCPLGAPAIRQIVEQQTREIDAADPVDHRYAVDAAPQDGLGTDGQSDAAAAPAHIAVGQISPPAREIGGTGLPLSIRQDAQTEFPGTIRLPQQVRCRAQGPGAVDAGSARGGPDFGQHVLRAEAQGGAPWPGLGRGLGLVRGIGSRRGDSTATCPGGLGGRRHQERRHHQCQRSQEMQSRHGRNSASICSSASALLLNNLSGSLRS